MLHHALFWLKTLRGDMGMRKNLIIMTLFVMVPAIAHAQAYSAPSYQSSGGRSSDPYSDMYYAVAARHGYNLAGAHEQVMREAIANAFSSSQYLERVQFYLHSGIGQVAAEAMTRRDIVRGTPALAPVYHQMYEQNDNAILAGVGIR